MRELPYSIHHHASERADVISVAGDADVTAAAELTSAIDNALTPTVVVDLSKATLVDSRTIAILVDRTERLRGGAGDLIVVGPDPNIMRLLRRIGLDDQLTIVSSHPEVEAARARRG